MELLIQAFRESSTPVYMVEKMELLEYYHDTYADEWKRHLVDALHQLTGVKRSSSPLFAMILRVEGIRIGEECDDRDFSAVALGVQAYQLVNAPSFGVGLWIFTFLQAWSLEITPLA